MEDVSTAPVTGEAGSERDEAALVLAARTEPAAFGVLYG